jgi:hypothetical protein
MSSCDICSELYSLSGPLEPRILNCGHTICLKCLTFLLTSSLKSCCPFCKSSFYETKIRFPKNYALLETIRSRVCDDESLAEGYQFDMIEVDKLKEQAKDACAFERFSLAEQIEYSKQLHQCLNHSTEDKRRHMEYLRDQTILRCQKSHQRLQKYECIASLLDSIISFESTGFPQPLPCLISL